MPARARHRVPASRTPVILPPTGTGRRTWRRNTPEHSDGARDQEREPYGRARDFSGCPEQSEDARSDHRADPDEGGLAYRQLLGRSTVHRREAL